MENKKRNAKEPTTNCQYGDNCYRKNPSHFADYAHQHLTSIRELGRDSATNKYTVPDEYRYAADTISEQLQILDNLFPCLPIAKKPKLPADESTSISPPSPQKNDSSSRSPHRDLSPNRDSAQSQNTITKPSPRKQAQSATGSKTINKNTPLTAKVTATQLKDNLRATFEKVVATSAVDVSQSAPKNQTDQLAEYRRRHIQNRPAASSSNQSTSSTANESSRPAAPAPSTPNMSNKVERNIHDYISVVNPKGEMATKLAAAAPYNFFLTTITASKPTHSEPLSITFQEILDPSLGEIESSVQMNFMVDIGWLLGHYYFAGCLDKPLLVLYGDETADLKMVSSKKPQVTAVKVQMSSPFGTHHTKMMLLAYKNGSMRVVVSTANLVEDDWYNRTQGIWLSPRCPALADDADTGKGESATGFRDDLMRYLITYNIPALQPWIARIRKTDFSKVNVFFVASVPGGHRETPRGYQWGHARVGHLLSQHCAPVDDACPIVAQSSSIGSLGASVQTWIMADIANSFRKDSLPIGLRRLPAFRMVYPSFSNVKGSHDDLLGGGCLPYRKAINDKQPWLKSHLFQWKSRNRHRSQAMPHIKTYCRWSDRGLYWFVLTSANLSKAAWGAFNKGSKLDLPLRIMSYEAGVLFLPKFVLENGENFFPMNAPKNGVPPFPMPYDLPLVPYSADDTPFVMDYLLS